jgi:hypothetical protein
MRGAATDTQMHNSQARNSPDMLVGGLKLTDAR